MRAAIKDALGAALLAGRAPTVMLRRGALVVAFHRVMPDAGDDLTVTTAQFDEWCAVFGRAFSPVTLDELVMRLRRGYSVAGLLAITFDDGYADNYLHAAPILAAHALPATFFVVTRWIGTQTVAWWDRSARVPHPWMTWDQVRALRTRGFDIGAHTQFHSDLGAVTSVEARREVVGSHMDLERALGEPAGAFAYPYGRPANITDDVRQLVREAGFTCCCSAFGGVNGPGTDPFALVRVPINAHSPSPNQLGFDLAFGRTRLAV